MAKKLVTIDKVILNRAGISRHILLNEKVARYIKSVAEVVAQDAGPGHVVVRGDRAARSRFAVITETHTAMREQAINQRLSRAVESIRSVIDPHGPKV